MYQPKTLILNNTLDQSVAQQWRIPRLWLRTLFDILYSWDSDIIQTGWVYYVMGINEGSTFFQFQDQYSPNTQKCQPTLKNSPLLVVSHYSVTKPSKLTKLFIKYSRYKSKYSIIDQLAQINERQKIYFQPYNVD